jgi:hypothetical protein
MCTVSWRRGRDGYDLFFNRDELNVRAPESPPVRLSHDGVDYLAPRDGARGGTWLLVNANGVTVCLLNDYTNPWRPTEALSRGEIVQACAAVKTAAEVAATIRAQRLERTEPFHVLALAPSAGPLLLRWDGVRLDETSGAAVSVPLSSSSFASAEVIDARVRRFSASVRETAAPEIAELAAYHRQHDPQAGAYSVLMRRPDAATRSICHVSVAATRVRLGYVAVGWNGTEPMLTERQSLLLDVRF